MSRLPNIIRIHPARAEGTLEVPASKSYTNRALLLASLAKGTSTIYNPLRSDDAEAMTEALRTLGVGIEDLGDRMLVHGTGRFSSPDGVVHCRDSGTTIRFLAAAAGLCDYPVTLTGSEQLCRRPLGPLLECLSALGVEITSDGGRPPVTIRGPFRSLHAVVDAGQSSQYASAMLMALGAAATAGARLEVRNLVSAPYVDMTLDSLRDFGVEWVSEDGEDGAYACRSANGCRAAEYRVEYDASAAGHIWAIAAASGGRVTVNPAHRRTGQPDIRLLGVLESMGCSVIEDSSGVTVSRAGKLKSPGEVNLADWPDMLTTVAVLAALAEGTTTITGAAHARGHETDRIAAVTAELTKLGALVTEFPDGLAITGADLRPARIRTYGDHRMAMAFAAAGAAADGITLEEPACVRKTYPGFWTDIRNLGIDWEGEDA